MKFNLLLIGVLVLVVLSTNSFAGQSAEQCLRVYVEGDETYFENTCSEKITVAFCSTSKPINGKLCGEHGSDWNPYYTQMFTLEPNKKDYKWKVGKVRYAVCLGFINGWNAEKYFSSDIRGNYNCMN